MYGMLEEVEGKCKVNHVIEVIFVSINWTLELVTAIEDRSLFSIIGERGKKNKFIMF